MPPRHPLSRTFQAAAGAAVVFLTGTVWIILVAGDAWPLRLKAGVFALVALLLAIPAERWLTRHIVGPLRATEAMARRIAQGDLRVSEVEIRAVGGWSVTEAFRHMVAELRRLMGAIQQAAQESAALSQQISDATRQMAGSTEEVASTTAELTDRAIAQAGLVRSVADDASRILAIAQDVATTALKSVDRNAALAALARTHRERLGKSAAALEGLAREVELGTAEAEALARASEEIERFLVQARSIAKQTRVLALNAAIEAARAGEHGQGFSVVADEVRKRSGQAGLAATATTETVRAVVARVETAQERMLRLGRGGLQAREAALAAVEGLDTVAKEAEANDAWTRGVSRAAHEVRGLIESIADRTRELAAGTESYAASAEQIAASAEELNASTEEVTASAGQLASAGVRLREAAGSIKS